MDDIMTSVGLYFRSAVNLHTLLCGPRSFYYFSKPSICYNLLKGCVYLFNMKNMGRKYPDD